jgi:hypothetical protein
VGLLAIFRLFPEDVKDQLYHREPSGMQRWPLTDIRMLRFTVKSGEVEAHLTFHGVDLFWTHRATPWRRRPSYLGPAFTVSVTPLSSPTETGAVSVCTWPFPRFLACIECPFCGT